MGRTHYKWTGDMLQRAIDEKRVTRLASVDEDDPEIWVTSEGNFLGKLEDGTVLSRASAKSLKGEMAGRSGGVWEPLSAYLIGWNLDLRPVTIVQRLGPDRYRDSTGFVRQRHEICLPSAELLAKVHRVKERVSLALKEQEDVRREVANATMRPDSLRKKAAEPPPESS